MNFATFYSPVSGCCEKASMLLYATSFHSYGSVSPWKKFDQSVEHVSIHHVWLVWSKLSKGVDGDFYHIISSCDCFVSVVFEHFGWTCSPPACQPLPNACWGFSTPFPLLTLSALLLSMLFVSVFFFSISYQVPSRPYRILQWHITQQHTCDPWQLSPWPGAGLSLSKLTAIKQHDPAAPLGSSQMGVSKPSPMHLSVWRCCADVVFVEYNRAPKRVFSLQWHWTGSRILLRGVSLTSLML